MLSFFIHIFQASFRICAFKRINSSSSQFHVWYLLSIFLMCGALLRTLYFSSTPIDKNLKPLHIRRIESNYRAWNSLYFGRWIIACKCTFPKKMPEMCGWRRTTVLTSHVISKAENYMPSGVVRFRLWLWERTACRCKTLSCGYAVKTSELVYTTESQGNEPTYLKSVVRM